MNKEDYIWEGLRQLDNTEHYHPLDEDLTKTYNGQLLYIIKLAIALNITDDKMEKVLYTKLTRRPNFYMLPKIHKANNPGRPTVN